MLGPTPCILQNHQMIASILQKVGCETAKQGNDHTSKVAPRPLYNPLKPSSLQIAKRA
jgi:hypothetical protein